MTAATTTHATNLLHHLVLFMEELHLDVSTNRQRLGEFEKHVLVLAPRVSGVRRVNLHFQLVHHKLGICKECQRCTGREGGWRRGKEGRKGGSGQDYEICDGKETEHTEK